MRAHAVPPVLLIGLLPLLLTGCSSGSPAPTTSPTSSSTSAAAPDGRTPAPYDNHCDGDQAVISGDGQDHRLPKGCDGIAVTASGSTITLGPAKDLAIEGSNNEITVAEADSVILIGSNNKLHVADGDPAIEDQGTGNSVD